MAKFKVGDEVRVVQTEGIEYTNDRSNEEQRFKLPVPPGWTSTIKTHNPYVEPAWQVWGVPEWFFTDELELVEGERR